MGIKGLTYGSWWRIRVWRGEPAKQGVNLRGEGNLRGGLEGAIGLKVWPKYEPFGPAGSLVTGQNGTKTRGKLGGTGGNRS